MTDYIYVKGPVDAILHFASPASPVDYLELPIQTLKVGSLGTHKALGLAKEKGARFLLASHVGGLRRPARPSAERGLLGQRQSDRPARRLRRGQALRRGDDHGVPPHARRRDAHRPHLQHATARACGCDDGRVVPNFIAQALRGEPITVYGDGSQTRSFCYVSDLVEGIVRLLRVGLQRPGEHAATRAR